MKIDEEEAISFINWVIKHKRAENGKSPTNSIINISTKYYWIYNGYAYRGLKLYSWNINDQRILNKKKGDKIQYHPSKEYESWTLDQSIAVCFIIGYFYDKIKQIFGF